MNYKALAVLAAVSVLSGCASIVNGHNQSVSVTTHSKGADLSGAKCSLSNDKGEWFTTTPGSVTVRRSFKDLAVNCAFGGLDAGIEKAKSTTKPMVFGNILFGGVIGAGIDVASGAAYDYPDIIQVNMGLPNGSFQGDAAPEPLPRPASIGTRFFIREQDAVSGVATGESGLTLSSLTATVAEFNDGAVVLGRSGQTSKGATGGANINGLSAADLSVGQRRKGTFAPIGGGEAVPVDLVVVSLQTLPEEMGRFQVARVQVNGYAAGDLQAGTQSRRAPIEGYIQMELTTGLVLNANVVCRDSRYAMRRQMVRVVLPVGQASTSELVAPAAARAPSAPVPTVAVASRPATAAVVPTPPVAAVSPPPIPVAAPTPTFHATKTTASAPAAPPAQSPQSTISLAAMKGGVDGYNVEHLAEVRACAAQPRAVMVGKGPGLETYTVACANGDVLAVRCEMGTCRVLK